MSSLHPPRFRVLATAALLLWMGPMWTASAQESLTTLPLHDMSAFRPTAANWFIAGDVLADLDRRRHLETETGTGVLVCNPTEEARENLFTEWEHGDLTLSLEVMMPSGSNSGVYLQGRYEVQLFDSWAVRNPDFGGMGGIYQRWDESRPEGQKGFGGVAPRINAGRAPGLWQHLEIDFRAPRFDDQGRKIEDARFERVALNGVVVHENVVLTGPTRAAAFEDEAPTGPLMLQGDHGPVAFRDIHYKRYGTEAVRLDDLSYRVYDGPFDELPDFSAQEPVRRGDLDGFRHDVVGDLEEFAIEYEGTLTVPTTGTYDFELELGWVDDDPHFEGRPTGGGVVLVGNDTVLRHEGTGPIAEDDIRLQAGRHPFRVTYFKTRRGREPVALLTVEGPDTRRSLLNAVTSLPAPNMVGPIHLDVGTEPILQRHMLDRGEVRRTHVVSVGDPSGVHYTVDLDEGALLHVWRGPFVDATPMWHARGFHQLALPLGSVVAVKEVMPLVTGRTISLAGYELDEEGRPTFRYEADGAVVTDRLEPAMDGKALRRTVTAGEEGLLHPVARSTHIERLPMGGYAVDDRSYLIRFEGAAAASLDQTAGGYELNVPLGTGPLTYTIIW